VEKAFNELAGKLSARLDNENGAAVAMPSATETSTSGRRAGNNPNRERTTRMADAPRSRRGRSPRDKALLDLLPVGVLIYRSTAAYANGRFLVRMATRASMHWKMPEVSTRSMSSPRPERQQPIGRGSR